MAMYSEMVYTKNVINQSLNIVDSLDIFLN